MIPELKRSCDFLITNAKPASGGMCARAVRLAIDAGWKDLILQKKKKPFTPQSSAKNCGKSLEEFGFKKVFSSDKKDPMNENYQQENGDVAVIQYEPHGHICMRTEKGWISDFIQRDMYSGRIREKKPPFDIYRYGSA